MSGPGVFVACATAVTGVTVLGYTVYRIQKSFARVQNKPQNPPVAPPKEKQISREQMVEKAQKTLKMDITNGYNFAFCGCQGVG